MTGPLRGYTVVELATGIAGAYCTKLLADGGAQVIKVELQPAPLLGQHNHELLEEIGLSDAEIAALEAQGVVGWAPVN